MDTHRPVALITGGARRIGAGIVRSLHDAGYAIALHYRHSHAEAQALVAQCNANRAGSAIAVQADLAHYDRIPELIARTVGHFGRLDALINNASAFQPTPIGSITPAQWDALFASNARAPLFLAQAAAPHLIASKGGIVNLVDLYAERPLPQHTVYCMAKAALVMLTKSLAVELAPQVRVNAIAPGAILWPEHTTDAAAQAAMLQRTPLARTGEVQEIGQSVLWLLRDAGYVTGQVLRLDGGRSVVA